MVLADLGADVIKVEPPEGDATVHGPPWIGPAKEGGERVATYHRSIGTSAACAWTCAGAEGEVAGGRSVGRMCDRDPRPGGLGAPGHRRRDAGEPQPEPGSLSITGYGPDGPDVAKPGYDFVAQAVGG